MNTKLALGLIVVGIFILIVLIGPLMEPYPPSAVSGPPLVSPTISYPMGTDHLGRDVFSRILAGSGGIITTAFLGILLGTFLGVILGFVGFFGGFLDEILMGFVDLLLSFPVLLTGLLVVSALGNESVWLILGTGFIFMPRTAKVVRASVLNEKTEEYITAAKAIGASDTRIVFKHILPNVFYIVIVEVTTRFAQGLLLVSALSFLGLGTPLDSPDWGRMISDGRDYLLVAPWIVLFPAGAISLLVIAVNLVADGLQETSTNRYWSKANNFHTGKIAYLKRIVGNNRKGPDT